MPAGFLPSWVPGVGRGRQTLGGAAAHGCEDKLLHEAQRQGDPHLSSVQMHRGSRREKILGVFHAAAEDLVLLFTTEQLQAVPWLRRFLDGE